MSSTPQRAGDFTDTVAVQMVVGDALKQLPLGQRKALMLCDLAGLSCKEAAERMGTTSEAVSSSRRRARERFKQIMIEQGYQPRNHEQGDQPGKEAER